MTWVSRFASRTRASVGENPAPDGLSARLARPLLVIGRACAASALCAASTSCFYVPPITPVPTERDTPPFLLGFEAEMTVDLSAASDARFTVDAVYDLNDTEQIDWSSVSSRARRPLAGVHDRFR